MDFLKYIVPPLVGAIIGYVTNFIAIKMLFHPYKPWKIGKFTVPMTPGVVPRRKYAISHAVGQAIENDLISRDDLKDLLISDGAKNAVVQGIVHALLDEDCAMEDRLKEQLGEAHYDGMYQAVEHRVCGAIANGIAGLDLIALLKDKGVEAAEKHLGGGLFAMFLTTEKLQSIAEGIGKHLTEYLQENATELLQEPVDKELRKLTAKTPGELLEACHLTAESLEKLIELAYVNVISQKADVLLKEIHIGQIAEEKINQMSNQELEKLTLSVMRSELNTVVNLGAILGALIGMVNVFF